MHDKLWKNLSIIYSAMGIAMIFIDFYVTREFQMEGIFVIAMSLLLLGNILRLSNKKMREKKWLRVLSNIGILGFVAFNLWVLLILSFGFGYAGRAFPVIMICAVLYNGTFIPVILYDLIYVGKNKSLEN